jgi:NADH-quinone oxidoreductase subunit M
MRARFAQILAVPVALLGFLSAPRAARADGPHITLSPTSLAFPKLDKSDPVNVTITNDGDASADIYAIQVAPDAQTESRGNYDRTADLFKVTLPQGFTPGQPLAAGQSLTVSVAMVAPVQQPDEDPGNFAARAHRAQVYSALQVISSDAHATADWPNAGNMTNHYVTSAAIQGGGSHGHLISWMVFFPLLGIIGLFLVPKGKEELVRWVAMGACLVPALLGIFVYFGFDRSAGIHSGGFGLQMVDHAVWIRAFNIEYFFGVDGVSVLMIILTGIVSAVACGASWSIPKDKSIRGYFAMFLLLEVGMMGVFAALDFFMFYVFREIMLLPMYFLIGIWGGPRKEYAAIKFFLYTLAGSVLMLLAVIALYYNSAPTYLVDGTPAPHTFDLLKLAYANNFSTTAPLLGLRFSYVVWMALFIGFAIKVPMFPFHTWLPDAHVEAPTAISVILAGVLLKMGTYGMMRICWPILPEATQWAAYAVAVFGVINILYGAMCAMAQTDLKKLVAYSSVSHMGFCLLGMAAFTQTGMNGAMMQMFNHGTITSMLFICVGILYDRAHTRDLNAFGGLASAMPRYAALFSFAFMASLGLPGLSGFIGEMLVVLGAFPGHQELVGYHFFSFTQLTILASTGVIITAGYHLWAIQRIHLGKFNEHWGKDSEHSLVGNDVTLREVLTLAPMIVIVLVLGFYPAPVLNLMSQSMHDLVDTVKAGAFGGGQLAAAAVHQAGKLAMLP